jgi:hypothetical protein
MHKMKSDGTRNVWKYIHIVARNPGAVLSRNRKTELRTTLDKCTYTEYLASVMAPMRTNECDPSYLREPHLTSRSSDDRISGPDGTGNWNLRLTSRR